MHTVLQPEQYLWSTCRPQRCKLLPSSSRSRLILFSAFSPSFGTPAGNLIRSFILRISHTWHTLYCTTLHTGFSISIDCEKYGACVCSSKWNGGCGEASPRSPLSTL